MSITDLHMRSFLAFYQPRQTEVNQPGVAIIVYDHVFRLHIAVNQDFSEMPEQEHQACHIEFDVTLWQPSFRLTMQKMIQILATTVLHDISEVALT